MKIKIKKNYLIGTLLSTFLIIGIINITNGQVIINTNPDISKLHTPSLISLFLGDNDSNYAQIKVNSGKNYLNISNGLIVGNNTIDSSAQLSVIGGGKSNVMNASNAGIGGGRQNRIYNDNGAIGGGERNTISEENGTIVGGNSNQVKQDNGGIVIGGYMNQSLGGIILGGKNNIAGKNGLSLGSNSVGGEYSFSWNNNIKKGSYIKDSAHIISTGGMLIGTYKPITGVSLVVNGSIKLGSSNVNNTGGIYIDSNKCIKFYDGSTSNTLGKVSEYDTKCLNRGCNFGITSLHNGDKVVAYSKSYATKCDDIKQIITCNNGELVDQNNGTGIYIYPYCYDLSPDPSIQVEEGKQNCPKLVIEHAIYLNPYFTQKLNKNTNEYTPKNGSIIYDPTGQKDCSFTCKENFEWNKDYKKCYGKTRSQSCSGSLPDNTFYDKNTFTQQWDGFKRSPEEVMERHFAENYSGQPCEFTCKENYEWNNSTKTCEAKDLECRKKPRGSDYSGYILGSSTYKYGYTPISWTYTENNNPGTCQFTCKTNYKYITGTNTCEPETLSCNGSKPSGSGYILGSDQYIYGTINKTSWNYTGNSDPLSCQYTCDTANGYTEINNQCKCPDGYEEKNGKCEKTTEYKCKYETKNGVTYIVVNGCEGGIQATDSTYSPKKYNGIEYGIEYSWNCGTTSCSTFRTDNMCGGCDVNNIDKCKFGSSLSGSVNRTDNTETWECKKDGEPIQKCGYDTTSYEDRCKEYGEAYLRDEETNSCKYSPRFCMIERIPNFKQNKYGTQYRDGTRFNSVYGGDDIYHMCFDKQTETNTNHTYQGGMPTKYDYVLPVLLGGDEEEFFGYDYLSKFPNNLFIIPTNINNNNYHYYGDYGRSYLYPSISLDTNIEGEYTPFLRKTIKKGNCKASCKGGRDMGCYLDCSFDGNDPEYPGNLYRDGYKEKYELPYCY